MYVHFVYRLRRIPNLGRGAAALFPVHPFRFAPRQTIMDYRMTDTTKDNPPKSKRDCRLPETRVTASELETIKTRAAHAGLSTSEYLRRASLKGRVVVHDAATDVDAVRQLLAIGRNLNQLTKSGHINKGVNGAALSETLAKINNAVDGLMS